MVSLINRFRLSSVLTNAFRYSHANASSSKRTEGETKLSEILKKRFPDARVINVKDTSCKYLSPASDPSQEV